MSANDKNQKRSPNREPSHPAKSATDENRPPADPPRSPDVTYQPESGMPRPEPNQGDRTVANDG
jgi:hypothetical protein